ncbi:hypothetical protein FLK61_35610 [Paenalkalicoccus suaedae]|uniref:Peptidase S1 domain-containing protein n=1 Tax=Paenalkalicoccus suaedae TaxID=2592382 RepID=A0A859FH60_9BACI|nr:hypothetical protein [Paenalkalicoccus suaedae]QKS71992.1 hypothetical protein FLK61_35610 [Paenalkalicoccus suaedae]
MFVDFVNQKIDIGILEDNEINNSKVIQVLSEYVKLEDYSVFNIIMLDSPAPIFDESRSATTRPLRSGLVIDRNPNTTGNCSIAYSAIDSSNNPYIITAGHCWAGQQGLGLYQGGSYIGTVSSRAHYGGAVDAMGIRVSSNALLSNRIYNTATRLSNLEVAGNDQIGDIVCKSGMHGNSCSIIHGKNANGYTTNRSFYGRRYFEGLRASLYSSQVGDSGGLIHHNNTLKGVHKGKLEGWTVYSHVTHVTRQLGLTPVTW